MNQFYQMSDEEICQWLVSKGHSDCHLRDVLAFGYKRKRPKIYPRLLEDMKELSFKRPKMMEIQTSVDGTKKFLFLTLDGLKVEAVLLPFTRKYTLCISSQVGCGMACTFCRTGQAGLGRNLRAGEIVGMYLEARDYLWNNISGELPTPTIVFMGQGEPLHNFDQVKQALTFLTHPHKAGLGPRQITLSTVGYLPGLLRFNELPKINLAFSLHSPFQEERAKIMPISEIYTLDKIKAAMKDIKLHARQFINLEYLLIKDFNLTDAHADGLLEWSKEFPIIINLIPYNPIPGLDLQRPSDLEIEEFKIKLVERKLRVMVRGTKGDDVLAACGQLAFRENSKNKGLVPGHTMNLNP